MSIEESSTINTILVNPHIILFLGDRKLHRTPSSPNIQHNKHIIHDNSTGIAVKKRTPFADYHHGGDFQRHLSAQAP
jgi:hypothetical protein